MRSIPPLSPLGASSGSGLDTISPRIDDDPSALAHEELRRRLPDGEPVLELLRNAGGVGRVVANNGASAFSGRNDGAGDDVDERGEPFPKYQDIRLGKAGKGGMTGASTDDETGTGVGGSLFDSFVDESFRRKIENVLRRKADLRFGSFSLSVSLPLSVSFSFPFEGFETRTRSAWCGHCASCWVESVMAAFEADGGCPPVGDSKGDSNGVATGDTRREPSADEGSSGEVGTGDVLLSRGPARVDPDVPRVLDPNVADDPKIGDDPKLLALRSSFWVPLSFFGGG